MTGRRNPPLKFTLPDVVDPEERLCFTIRIPNNVYHIGAFRGAMAKLASAISWADDVGHTAKDVAMVWRGVVDEIEACMSVLTDVRQNDEEPCKLEKQVDGGPWVQFADMQLCPPRLRLNEGRMQFFDGENWIDLPDQGDEKDDGTADPQWPDPPSGETGNCLAAENIVGLLQQQVLQWTTALETGLIAMILVTTITGILSAFFIPFATPAILGFATGLVALGASGLGSAFTEGVYDELKCIIYSNASSDGSITVSQYEEIISEIEIKTGVAWDLIPVWLGFFGAVGLTRAAASAGITDGSCDECDTTDIVFILDAVSAAGSTIENIGGRRWLATAAFTGSGYSVVFRTNDDSCVAISDVVLPSVSGAGWFNCESSGGWPSGVNFTIPTVTELQHVRGLSYFDATNPFTIEFTANHAV